jgi:hypothetical protein
MSSNESLSNIPPQRSTDEAILKLALRIRTSISYGPQIIDFQKGDQVYNLHVLPFTEQGIDKAIIVAYINEREITKVTVSVDYAGNSGLNIDEESKNVDSEFTTDDLIAILEQSTIELEG